MVAPPMVEEATGRPIELLNMSDHTSNAKTRVGLSQPLFEPCPKVVEFKGYEAYGTYEKVLKFRNTDYAARRIRIEPSSSPYFEVATSVKKKTQSKVATGMEIGFVIRFKPQEVREYRVDLVCVTEREKFLVPVRALGYRPELQLPKALDFGRVPVKALKEKPLVVHSTGQCTAMYTLRTTGVFKARPSRGEIEPGGAATFYVQFEPSTTGYQDGAMEIHLQGDRVLTVPLMGSSEEVDVRVSTSSAVLEPAYVSLQSVAKLEIHNGSEIPAKFHWAQCASLDDQEVSRAHLYNDLVQMKKVESDQLEVYFRETFEKKRLERQFSNAVLLRDSDDDDDDDLSGDEGAVPAWVREKRAALDTKYRHLFLALDRDPMHFADQAFELRPNFGIVPPKSFVSVQVFFKPDLAVEYNSMAYLDVVGRKDRLPVCLTGVGIGPKVALSYEVLDQGDCFVGSTYTYTLTLTNQGDIPADWTLKFPSQNSESSFFQFEPQQGLLEVGSECEISVVFLGSSLGEFDEVASIQLEGSNETLNCRFKGHVIGPTFEFDTKLVDFGLCSYSFRHDRQITLTNTSDIGMGFHLRVPNDPRKEFSIQPDRGTLLAGERVQVQVQLTPHAVRNYEASLFVDVDSVGDSLASLPLSADCAVPDVYLHQKGDDFSLLAAAAAAEGDSAANKKKCELDYGKCSIRYPYERDLVLVNAHPTLAARFEVAQQDAETCIVAEYRCEPSKGVVPPNGKVAISVTLKCNKLGTVRVPFSVSIAGSAKPPLTATLLASSKGPDVTLSAPELTWGSTECLIDAPRVLTLSNESPIPAPVKTFVKNARSKFRVDVKETVMAPFSKIDLTVVACLDDTVVHKDQLHLIVAEGENLMVPLSAKGVGTTIDCFEDLKEVNFGPQFSSEYFERKITLENKGRRSQTLKWMNTTTMNRKKKDKTPQVFSVIPEEVELRPRTAAVFTFRGFSEKAGSLQETLVCETRVHKEKSSKPVFTTCIKADVIDPLLQFSCQSLDFRYDYEPRVPSRPQMKEFKVTNGSVLPLVFSLKCAQPFSLDTWEHSLEPSESTVVQVHFDPGFFNDKQSKKLEQRLTVSYVKHPQKDSLPLLGEINFPNLALEADTVNFGCVLNDTTMSRRMRIQNSSKVECVFSWAFLSSADKKDDLLSEEEENERTPVNQVFDILPIRSRLGPGDVEDVEFVYYGHAGRAFKGSCICEVEGGPEYKVSLLGEASTVSYALDKESIDFGNVLYTKTEDSEIVLHNTGKVAFPFSIRGGVSDEDVLTVAPRKGDLGPGEKQVLSLRIAPKLPLEIRHVLKLDIAHFEPVEFPVTVSGVFPLITTSLPRDLARTKVPRSLGGSWSKLLKKAHKRLRKANRPLSAPHVEAEANRLLHLDHLQQEQAVQREGSLSFEEEEQQRVVDVPSALKKTAGPTKKTGSKKQLQDAFVLGWHVCDLGNVVSGTSRKKTFTMTNASETGPLSWAFEKKLLANTGFGLDPEKVNRVPEGGTLKYEVSFVARKNTPLGRKELHLPIDVKNGPSSVLILTANVTAPELKLSADALDFGQVWTGCGKVMHLQLHNPSPVVADWEVVKPLASAREFSKFSIKPFSGSLAPGAYQLVKLEFSPEDDRPISFKLPFKCSTKSYHVTLTGVGVPALLRFDPPLLDFAPVLPMAEPIALAVSLLNVSQRPLDVYSLDFDQDYLRDEALLLDFDGYDPDDQLLRLPLDGHPVLPAQLVPSPNEEEDPGSNAEQAEDGPCPEEQRAPAESDPANDDAAAAVEEEVFPNDGLVADVPLTTDDANSLRSRGLAKDFALVAAPLAGGRELASKLAREFGYAVATPHGALRAVAKIRSSLGTRVRRHLGVETEGEIAQQAVDKVDAAVADAVVAATVARLALDAEKARNKKKSKKSEDPPVVEDIPPYEVHEPSPDEILTALYADCVAWRKNQPDAGRGLVVDLTEPHRMAPATSLLIDAVQKAGATVFSFSLDAATYRATLLALKEHATDAIELGEADRVFSSAADSDDDPEAGRPPSRVTSSLEECQALLERIANALSTECSEQNQGDSTLENVIRYAADADSLNVADPEDFEVDAAGVLQAALSRIPEPAEKHTESAPSPREEESQQSVALKKEDIPEPTTRRLIKKPAVRPPRPPQENFAVVGPKSRWTLGPNESVELLVEMRSSKTGECASTLSFEVAGLKQDFGLRCRGAAALPGINADPRNVFMHRVKTRTKPVFKRYVASEAVFDFGPCLTWKTHDRRDDPVVEKSCCDAFRISNNSALSAPITVAFDWQEGNSNRFVADPETMELAPGETKDLKIWAFPGEVGTFVDTLLACVAQNPQPIPFKVRCQGVEPKLALRGPFAAAAESSSSEGGTVLDFDRLLLGRSETRELTLVNESLCAVSWRLDASALDEELTISPTTGTIPIAGTARISVAFSAKLDPKVLEPRLVVEYSDDQGGFDQDRIQKLEFSVKAEAYRVKCVVIDDSLGQQKTTEEKSQPGTLNFGQIRVGEMKKKGFALKNTGKYDVGFKFEVRGGKRASKSSTKDVLTVTPASGIIEAGNSTQIDVYCGAAFECKLQDNKDLVCVLSEPSTNEAVESFPVTVAVQTVFPSFRLQPLRGLSFGTLKYNDPPKEKTLELRNEGRFSLAFALFDLASVGNDEEEDAPTKKKRLDLLAATPRTLIVDERDREVAMESNVLPPNTEGDDLLEFLANVDVSTPVPSAEPVRVGQFKISPGGGVVEPGQTLSFSVQFEPKGCDQHKAFVALKVAGCDPNDPNAVACERYEISAESRSPGVETNDWDQIFEEQAVVARLAESEDDVSPSLPTRGGLFAIQDKTFSFGTTVLTENRHSSAERVKLINPNKVTAVVNVSIRGPDAEAFAAQPSSWEIPPFEHRYVTVYFQPSEMREYKAEFAATVVDSVDEQGLIFHLAGTGALPSITVAGASSEGDALALNFGRVQAGVSRVRSLRISNDGVLQATAMISLDDDQVFACPHAGSSITLEPGESRPIDVEFSSSTTTKTGDDDAQGGESTFDGTLHFKVLDNRYEATSVHLKATTFESDVIVEHGGTDGGNLVDFGQINLADADSENYSKEIVVRNTRSCHVRAECSTPTGDVVISPSVLHLAPGQSKRIVLSLENVNVGRSDRDLKLETTRISYPSISTESSEGVISRQDEDGLTWDSEHCVLKAASPDDLDENGELVDSSQGRELVTRGGTRMVRIASTEPSYEATHQALTQNLKCVAVADSPAVTSEVSVLNFRPSAMYQTHSHVFAVTNSSKLDLEYRWKSRSVSSSSSAPMPFSIEPEVGILAAESSTNFTAKFAPLEVDDYDCDLECVLPALEHSREDCANDDDVAKKQPIVVKCRGTATRPVCHFDVEDESEYLTQRTSSNLLNEHGRKDRIAASTVRVVKVASRGIRVQNTKRFLVTNPTSHSYDFYWEACGQPSASWRCATARGKVRSGKRGEMMFEFTPTHAGLAEAFFRFKIPSHQVDELFLFVGTVLEPRVVLDRARVDFSAVMLGSTTTETIHVVNSEHLPFAYAFDAPRSGQHKSVSGTRFPILEVTPSSGVVPPNGRAAVELVYRPTEEGPLNANLQCTIRKKQMRLGLNVKGEGYKVHARLSLRDGTKVVELKPAPATNAVSFGAVHLNKTCAKSLIVANSGKFNVDYLVDKGLHSNPMLLIGGSVSGTVRKSETVELPVTFHPVSPTKLESQVVLTLAGKLEFVLKFEGRGVAPALHFSTQAHDFGPRFVRIPGSASASGGETAEARTVLRVSNRDPTQAISLDCTLPTNPVLTVDCPPVVLSPGESTDIPIEFAPRDAMEYVFPVPFLVDGATTVTCTFTGKGVVARLELANPAQSRSNFGDVPKGDERAKKVDFVNRAGKATSVSISQKSLALLAEHEVKCIPTRVSDVRAFNGSAPFEFVFAPTKRAPRFEAPVVVEYGDGSTEKTLLNVSGRATGMEVSLSADVVSFGQVCAGSSRTRTVRLENSGDVGTSFKWNRATLNPALFDVKPESGSVRAGEEVAFQITFSPTEIDDDVRLEGMELALDCGPGFRLTCCGACVPQPEDSKQPVDFGSIAARGRSSTQLTVANPSTKPWFLCPTLKKVHRGSDDDDSSSYFSLPTSEIAVPAQGKASFEVVYAPLTQGEHSAHVFVALPDGSASSYSLTGVAGPPEPTAHPCKNTTAKHPLAVTIPVTNWLSTPQRFHVTLTLEDCVGIAPESTELRGATTHDARGAEASEYQVRVTPYLPGSATLVVLFKNPDTGDYVEHRVPIQVGPPKVSATLDLEAPVRQSARKTLVLDNPLPKGTVVTFDQKWWTCDSPDVRVVRVGENMGPEIVFQVEYRPLAETDDASTKTASLTLSIRELGDFPYTLRLKATPETSKPQVLFDTSLGASETKNAVFTVFAPSPTSDSVALQPTFSKKSNCCFSIAVPKIEATGLLTQGWDGASLQVPITFEPDAVGPFEDVLTLDAGPAGTYKCSLKGVCKRPAPRGPFSVTSKPVSIEFRNVFPRPTDFKLALDSDLFALAGQKTITVPARASSTFSVSFSGTTAATAKLLVTTTTPSSPDGGGGASSLRTDDDTLCWTFYLRGVPPPPK